MSSSHMLTTKNCGNCQHSRIADARNLNLRLCAAHPPHTHIIQAPPPQMIQQLNVWPQVNKSDRCGEFALMPLEERALGDFAGSDVPQIGKKSDA